MTDIASQSDIWYFCIFSRRLLSVKEGIVYQIHLSGMYLTRRAIDAAWVRVRKHLARERRMGKRSRLWRAARGCCRGGSIVVNYDRCLRPWPVLMQHDGTRSYWAETDGRVVWLNACMQWTPELLYWTLLHEVLHGAVQREGGRELSEHLEHRIMAKMDHRLL